MSGAPAPRKRLSIAALAALIALATGAVGLVLTVRPDLAADPRTRLGATIKSVAVDRRVNRDDFIVNAVAPANPERERELVEEAIDSYLDGEPASPAERSELRESVLKREIGSVVYAQVQGTGLKNRKLDVFWWVYDAKTRKRDYGGPSAKVTVKAPDDSFIVPTFVTDAKPCTTLRYLRLELRDQNETLVAMSTSKPYRTCPSRRAKPGT